MRKQILLCAAACFLLSVFLCSCQTERGTTHHTKLAARSSGNQASQNKSNDAPDTKSISRKYYDYAFHKQTVKAAPQVAGAHPVSIIQPAQASKPVAVAPAVVTAPPDAAVPSGKKLTAENTGQVTIIIKDSVDPGNTTLVAVTQPDTIRFNETHKDDMTDTGQAAVEEPFPLSPEEMDTVLSKYAEMISVERSEISNFNLYFFIDEWYGTKYKFGGMDSTGIDCSAFSQKLYGKVFGVDILRTAREQHKHCERVKYPDDVNEGDLVFFRIHHLRVSHVGVYLANGYFVHSSSSKGVVISNLNNKYWHRRFAGCGRIPREERSIMESDFAQ